MRKSRDRKRAEEKEKRRQREDIRRRREEERKTELANRIAHQSKKMTAAYQRFEDALVRLLRRFSQLLDKLIFNRRHSLLISFVLALILTFTVNASTWLGLTRSSLTSSRTLTDVAVTASYNTDAFELSGLPETVDVTFTGDASSVTAAANSDGQIVADLEGLTEGTHSVKLKGEGYSEGVNLKIDPSNVTITLKKKTTRQFDLSYDYINTGKMDPIYSLGTPEFETEKINVRASKDTLDQIASVKALIDVSGASADFEQDAILVAYDAKGQVVNADIVPDTVHVKVPVSSNSKTVAIQIEVTGEVPDDKALASVTSDQQTVNIYGTEEVLAEVDHVTVTLDASTITKDSSVLRPITLPEGVTSASINQVTLTVKLGEKKTKTIDNVNINYINNTAGYTAQSSEDKTTTSVTVEGTAENIADVTADDINVYIDLADAEPGEQTFELQVEEPSNGLVYYRLSETSYELTILGTAQSSADTEDEGE